MKEPFNQVVFYYEYMDGVRVEFCGPEGHVYWDFKSEADAKKQIEFWSRLYNEPQIVEMRRR